LARLSSEGFSKKVSSRQWQEEDYEGDYRDFGGGIDGQRPGQLQRQRAEHFPVMHGAIQELRQTKQALQNDAASDFHGHKTNAINHIDAAIQELQAGIQEERKH
jgi:hypothetical protein